MVNTRRTKRNQGAQPVSDSTAAQLIAQGGNRALRKALGIKPRPKRAATARKPASEATCGCAAQEREIARLLKIIAQIKAGRNTARKRGAARAAAKPEYRQANLYEREMMPYMLGGEMQEHVRPESLWQKAQRSEAQNRERRRTLPRRPMLPGSF